MHNLRAVVFDLDDTLVDSRKDYPKFKRCVFQVLVAHGVEESLLDPSLTVAANITKAKAFLLWSSPGSDTEELERAINETLNRLEMEGVGQVRPIPGAKEALDKVRGMGMRVAVLTRASREYTEWVLGWTGMGQDVAASVCRDDYPIEEAKPNPLSMMRVAARLSVKPTECLVLGDHPMDAECAAACGADFVGVLTGSTDEEKWRSCGCERVIESVAEAPEVVGGYLSKRSVA